MQSLVLSLTHNRMKTKYSIIWLASTVCSFVCQHHVWKDVLRRDGVWCITAPVIALSDFCELIMCCQVKIMCLQTPFALNNLVHFLIGKKRLNSWEIVSLVTVPYCKNMCFCKAQSEVPCVILLVSMWLIMCVCVFGWLFVNTSNRLSLWNQW